MRKTKIVCTLGPASENEQAIEKLFKSGMNVARLNFSHGTHGVHKKSIELFKKVRDRLELPAAILLDTKGPEIRTRTVKNGEVVLKEGQSFKFVTRDVEGDSGFVSITYSGLNKLVKSGNIIKVDDGSLIFEVIDVNDDEITCNIVVGGVLKNSKSINVPGVHLDMPYLSDKDKADVLFAIENDVDYIAASFVRT